METGRERCDTSLLWLTVLLLLVGLAVVLDASYARAAASGNDPFFYVKKQAQWAVLSLIVLTVAMNFPYWHLRHFWIILPIVAVVLLILVMIPGIGIEVNGSRRWLGTGSFRFQPSEFAKIAVVIFLARWSDLKRQRIRRLITGFLPAVGMMFLIGGLVAKEDLGTGITIVGTGLIMIFVMGARPKHMGGLFGLAMFGGVVLLLVEQYRRMRIGAWLNLIHDPVAFHHGLAYQPSQGLIALGSGGLTGQGIARGSAKYMYLPEAHTDYVFATWGQDVGFLGCIPLLLAFAWLIIRGLNVAHRTRDWFGGLLAIGMTSIIAVQIVVNLSVVTGLLPCTGIPLPFISYGGSSLVFTAMAVGIILNVSKHPNRGIKKAKARQTLEDRADGWRHRRPHLSRS